MTVIKKKRKALVEQSSGGNSDHNRDYGSGRRGKMCRMR